MAQVASSSRFCESVRYSCSELHETLKPELQGERLKGDTLIQDYLCLLSLSTQSVGATLAR
jgi:hypothetical protein